MKLPATNDQSGLNGFTRIDKQRNVVDSICLNLLNPLKLFVVGSLAVRPLSSLSREIAGGRRALGSIREPWSRGAENVRNSTQQHARRGEVVSE